MELKVEMAEAIVNDMIIDHVDYSECMSCGSDGEYSDNVKHTSACIVLKAKSFLSNLNGD